MCPEGDDGRDADGGGTAATVTADGVINIT
jgi:hypothetical protein